VPVDVAELHRFERQALASPTALPMVSLTRLGQPDGISPSRMAEILEVDKAGLKAAGVQIRYGVISAGAAVELVKAGNAGTDDDRVKIRGRVCLRLLRNRQ
jgi:hypothetical protein